MGITKCLVAILLLINFAYANEFAKDLEKKFDLQSDEFLLIGYYQLVGCVKCNILQFTVMQKVSEIDKMQKVKLVAAVRCDRELELSLFKKEENWKHEILVDNGKLKSSLGAKEDVLMTFISGKDHKITHVYGNENDKIDKIIKMLTVN